MTERRAPDRIAVRGLTAHAHHGVYAFEREQGQTFRVDAVLELDTIPAAAGDDLERTVNYAELAQRLHAVLTGEPVDLLETLAQRLVDVCLADPLVDAVEITVHKPEADLGVVFDDVTVTIRRERDPSLPATRELAAGHGDGATGGGRRGTP
ncbi:dihydroneopterin aldolase [Geodermatophilus sabuli]|uniref:7,8-dihydroneopterin aldolase n=1 Tax=Geodermatophilus sabuli TaxID=1564158 RepID=A0A7K3W6R9_9ACTN|nr:dihydroneopterin aldolase [Geodermatophilus sabuli]